MYRMRRPAPTRVRLEHLSGRGLLLRRIPNPKRCHDLRVLSGKLPRLPRFPLQRVQVWFLYKKLPMRVLHRKLFLLRQLLHLSRLLEGLSTEQAQWKVCIEVVFFRILFSPPFVVTMGL